MASRSKYPAVWCDFKACGCSGRQDDNCFYVLDQRRLRELGARSGDKVFLFMADSADGQEVTGIEGELLAFGRKLIARPLEQEYYHGQRFW